jgi:stage II sporulation protein D
VTASDARGARPRRAGRAVAVGGIVIALLGHASALPPLQPEPSQALRIGFARGRSYDAKPVRLETYVAQVLAGEAAPNSPPEALHALAIAIRTYALANRGRHRADGFDLCDQTHCQVVRAATPATERAARATEGRVLLHEGAPAAIYYSASCGGRTEVPSAVWPGAADPPYLPSRPDAACGGAPEWTTVVGVRELNRALSAAGFRGTLSGVRIRSYAGSGRVAALDLAGLTPSWISGQDLRMAVGNTLGWRLIRSTAFELRREPSGYRFTGHGFGHGVGLCVIGSVQLAATGTTADAILARYFPGLTLGGQGPGTTAAAREEPAAGSTARAGARADPPSAVSGTERVRALVGRAASDLAAALAVAPPAGVPLRIHESVEAFEQATGRRWYTFGAVAGAVVHLPPPVMLIERGILDRTVRREVARLLMASQLRERAAWVTEGGALYFADPTPGGDDPARTPSRAPCPSDLELLDPVSPGALTDAYARARACFARQLASGRSWQAVR